jgi:hypothetical protein
MCDFSPRASCLSSPAQVLESVVRTRWGALPDAQREGIKTYCSNLIIKISTDEKAFRAERTFLNKLNLVRRMFNSCCST